MASRAQAAPAEPPGGEGRTVAARGSKLPPQLDRAAVTLDQARKALAKSAPALQALVRAALGSGGKIRNFPPDAATFVAYLVAHDAHHRGQICMLCRQLGHRLPNDVTVGMWEWNKRRQEAT